MLELDHITDHWTNSFIVSNDDNETNFESDVAHN